MKRIVATLMARATLATTQAQFLNPEAFQGALWGGLIGGLAGADHCHDFSGEGAAIGAGIGLLAGSLIGESRRNDYYGGDGYYYAPAPSVSVSLGYGYTSCGSSAYIYYAPNRYCAPGYYYRPTRPNYVVSGTVLGAASGALIGAGNDNAGEGAAIGAAAGLALGGIAEIAAQRDEKPDQTVYMPAANTTAATTPGTVVAQPISRSEITATPCATSTYIWTQRPQIADAPRVPDAPSF